MTKDKFNFLAVSILSLLGSNFFNPLNLLMFMQAKINGTIINNTITTKPIYTSFPSPFKQHIIKTKKANPHAISPQMEVTFIFFRIGFILSLLSVV